MAQHPTNRTANNDPEPHLDDHNVILAPVHNMVEAAVLAATDGQLLRKRGPVFVAEDFNVAPGTELLVRKRGTGTNPGVIRFETQSSDGEPEPPWILQVANAAAQGRDHVFHHLFNLKWIDSTGGWRRLIDGAHCIRFGFESSFRDYALNPLTKKGTFEWNLDIDPNTTGAPFATQRRPWFLAYNLDRLSCFLQLGDPADSARNKFQLYGSVTDVTALALKTSTGVSFFQVSKGDSNRTIVISENGRLDVNADNNEEVRIGNHSTGGGSIWLNSVVEARNEVRFVGLPMWNNADNVQSAVGLAGGASALPLTPSKYLKVKDNTGAVLVIPAYAAS